jgi:malonyl CoA-acyl carrier protein transacylase
MKTALLFPGQGSQRVGMGRDLAHAFAAARRIYDEADAVLGFSLSKLCFEGPEDELPLTAVPVVANVTAQPLQDPAQIKRLLVDQVTAAVRWKASVQANARLGVTRAYELGSGSVLKNLVKRIADTIQTTAIGESPEVQAGAFVRQRQQRDPFCELRLL